MVKVISINLPKCTDLDNVNFLIAASNVFSCTEAARCYFSIFNTPSHDCFTCLLQKQPSIQNLYGMKWGNLLLLKKVTDCRRHSIDKPYSENGFCSLSVEREASSNC